MKKVLLSVSAVFLLSGNILHAQQTGPVAHWDMNGNTNDASGNGHNGIANNAVLTTGRDGIPSSAYYFSGNNSYIAAPYSTAWNVSQYTIGAVIKPTAFNTAPCQGNFVVARGPQTAGRWAVMYTDNGPNNGCNDVDTNAFALQTYPGLAVNSSGSTAYSPGVHTNQWYTVVCTYDGAVANTYVNGVLKSTVSYPGGIQSSMDGVTIGEEDPSPGAQNPFPFIGIIDDLIFYNRVLSSTEITNYGLPATGISGSPEANSNDVSVFPNPAQEFVEIKWQSAPGMPTAVRIVSALGQMVYQSSFSGAATRLPVSSLAPGVYSIQLCSGVHTVSKIWVRK